MYSKLNKTFHIRHEPRPLEQLEATMLDVFLYKFHNFKKEYDLIVREDFCRVDKEKFDYILFRQVRQSDTFVLIVHKVRLNCAFSFIAGTIQICTEVQRDLYRSSLVLMIQCAPILLASFYCGR